MLFENITILNRDLKPEENRWVGVKDGCIDYIGEMAPDADYGPRYNGAGRLLMPGFVNTHAHTPMTLMRGYGENLPLHSWLQDRIFPFEAQLDGEAVYWGMLLGLAESMRFGIVSSTDMYNYCGEMAKALLESGMKANIGRHVVAFGDGPAEQNESFAEAQRFYEQYNGMGGGRLRVDMALHAEYTSNPHAVQALAGYAKSTGARVHVHVAETEAETQGCKERHGKTPVRYLAGLGLFDCPATAAHCVWLEDDDFALLAQKDVTVASNPVSNLKLASGVCNTARLLKSGVRVSIGTDSVASNNSLNFIEEMKFFALVAKGARWLDATAITPAATLKAATLAGADSQGRADCGRMETGCRADLIVLDIDGPHMHPVHNLASNLVYAASGSDVRLTMVDGEVLYQDGEYKTIDIEKVKAEADKAARRVLAKV